MTVVLPTSLKYCCCTTLWNAEVVVWPFIAMNSHWVLCVAHALAQKVIETTKSLQICHLFNSESVVPRSQTSTNWNDASSASGPLWVTRLLTVLLESGVSVYALAFMLEADILSTGLSKDCENGEVKMARKGIPGCYIRWVRGFLSDRKAFEGFRGRRG